MIKSAIIVAGGTGSRMNAETPKQFLDLAGKPIVMWSIEKFYEYDKDIQILVVLPKDHVQIWLTLCEKHHFALPHSIVEGGKERFYSVSNALAHVSGDGWVAVHDGVRPLLGLETIKRCFDCAQINKAAVPVVELNDSLRLVHECSSQSVDRKMFRLVQTPQVFSNALIKEAYKQDYSPLFTDDASVVESLGQKIFLVEGNRENIKITTPMDLLLAEALIKQKGNP